MQLCMATRGLRSSSLHVVFVQFVSLTVEREFELCDT